MIIIDIFLIVCLSALVAAQSTCPVVQRNVDPNRCKCGIKTDGHIYIYCARKQLNTLPKFTKSSILYDELILSGNQITTINKDSFKGLKVKRLLLDDNPIEHIEPNSFIELANYLEEFTLSVNSDIVQSRPKISANLFLNLLNLRIVKLNGFDLGDFNFLKSNLFNRTRKLEVIHLIDIGLTRAEIFSLNGLETSLREFSLENNLLTSTNEILAEIKRMKRLNILNLSRNRIRQIPRLIDDTHSSLVDLQVDLSFNGIVGIDEYAFGVSSFDSTSTGLVNSITKLSLNNNELNQFQLNFLTQLTNLRELYIDFNKIDFLPDNIFVNLRKLEVLSLKGNMLRTLKSEFIFAGLDFNLKKLNLAGNKIESIEKRVFFQTNKLRELNLERNYLGVHFEQTNEYGLFEGVESELKVLNIENNNLKIEHLNSLKNLLNLEHLRIGNNNYEDLDLTIVLNEQSNLINIQKIFDFYRNLSVLDMQNTSLRQFPYFTGLNRSLVTLNLAQNKICNINGINLRKAYSRLKFLNINQNPIDCCNLKTFRDWAIGLENSNSTDFKCLSSGSSFKISELSFEKTCEEKCLIDKDEEDIRNSFSLHSSSTSTTTTTKTTTTTTKSEKILIVESNPTTMPSLPLTKSDNLILLNTADQILNRQQVITSVHQPSFFSSMELKQTLLGSFIGALSVLIIVLILVCVIKTTKNRFRDLSLCGSEKDKSNVTNSTSPYELGKLSLQTLCLNSNCSASTASTSSSTNSCVCNMMNNGDIFQKMDPMRLTLMNRTSVHHPGYLTNLHYLASNLPYTPGQSSSTSPTPYQINDSDINQYDKLQRMANTNSFSSLKPNPNLNTILSSQFSHNYNPNHLVTSTLSFQPHQFVNTEQTPFLLLTNHGVKMPEMVKQDLTSTLKNNLNNSSQHTYHEIGDVFIGNMNTFSRDLKLLDNQQQKQNELYI